MDTSHGELEVHVARKIVMLGAAAAAAILVIGCGGGGDEEDEPTQEPQATSQPPTEVSETPAAGDTVSIDESFWHAGWKVTLGDATFTAGDVGSAGVAIDATFENLGEDTATFDSQLVLTAGGENYSDASVDQDLPQVPGGLTGKGVIAFDVEDTFAFDDATLIIGNTNNNQAIVPLGPEGDALVTLEPRAIAVAGTVVAGALTVTIEGAELRADLPDVHSIAEKGKLLLTVRFSASPAAGIQIGQGVLQSEAVALKLPDGTAVAVRSDGRSGVNELLQGKEGTTIPELSVRFEIDDPAAGNYAFVLRGNYGPGGAEATGELAFVIP